MDIEIHGGEFLGISSITRSQSDQIRFSMSRPSAAHETLAIILGSTRLLIFVQLSWYLMPHIFKASSQSSLDVANPEMLKSENCRMGLSQSIFDLIVIGGGPAGASAAITAAREGARVLLLERGSFPRHKVCGEFVSAESLDLLGGFLGARHAPLLASAIRIPQARLFFDGSPLQTPIDPPAASIARLDLDAALWELAGEYGVETRQQTTVQVNQWHWPIPNLSIFWRVQFACCH
jgi:hypothetical protein